MTQDRLYIAESTYEIYKNSKILDQSMTNTEKFFVAMSLGYKMGARLPINSKKKDLVLSKYLTIENMALLNALAIKEEENISVISNLEKIFTISEEYANAGIREIGRIEKNSSFDEHTKKFEKLINDHIKSLNIE